MTSSESDNRTKSADALAHEAELDEQIARMRAMLKLMEPGSGATVLGAIRQAFPDVPLSDRIEALKTYR